MFVHIFSPLQTAAGEYVKLRVYVIYFPAHCAGVTNMYPRYNLSPLWRYIADIGVWDVAAPAKKRLPTCLDSDFGPVFSRCFRCSFISHFVLLCSHKVPISSSSWLYRWWSGDMSAVNWPRESSCVVQIHQCPAQRSIVRFIARPATLVLINDCQRHQPILTLIIPRACDLVIVNCAREISHCSV